MLMMTDMEVKKIRVLKIQLRVDTSLRQKQRVGRTLLLIVVSAAGLLAYKQITCANRGISHFPYSVGLHSFTNGS